MPKETGEDIAVLAKPLLSPEEFRVHGLKGTIGRNAVYDMLRSNRIRHFKIGRRILIPVSEVTDFPLREAMPEEHT